MCMIQRLRKTSEYIFRKHGDTKLYDFERTFYWVRTRTAHKLGNSRLLKIGFRTLRHFKATIEYSRTKDILHVMQVLGHKSIKNTLVYTHLVNFESDEYTVKVATSLEECTKLLEAGFEYVTDFEGKKLFRKRK